MEIFLSLLKSFAFGGAVCAVCQIFIDKTNVTPARILVSLVVSGVILAAVGLYGPVVSFAGAGATVPLLGFGYLLAEGVREGVAEYGLFGVLSGGLTAAAAGISATVFFGFIMAVLCRSKDKN